MPLSLIFKILSFAKTPEKYVLFLVRLLLPVQCFCSSKDILLVVNFNSGLLLFKIREKKSGGIKQRVWLKGYQKNKE